MLSFERSQEGGYQNRISAIKGEGGSKFWSFCENVIVE